MRPDLTVCGEKGALATLLSCCPRAILVDVKVMSATYGYNTKAGEPKAGGPAYDRLVAKDDHGATSVLEPKENV